MVKAGEFKADNYGVYSFMKEGGCSLAPLGTFEGKDPEEAMKLVAEREAAIKDGSISWSRSTTKSPSPADERGCAPGGGDCSPPFGHHQAFRPAGRQ
jgi:hypothetical protein